MAAAAAATYARERPSTTRHTGRSRMERRWWFDQKRMSGTTGNSSACASEHDQTAAVIGTT